MLISHYCEFAEHVTGGIPESVRHQRKMLDHLGHEWTPEPTLDADLLHLNLLGPRSAWYARRARRRGVPVVAHTHVTAEDFEDSFRLSNVLARPLRPYLRWAYGLADLLVCPSEYARGVVESYVDLPTTVVSNGVDAEKLAGHEDLAEEYRRRYDLSPPVVFAVGHVFRRKGLETFVETARRLPDVDFAWFGPIDRRLKGRRTRELIDESPPNCTFTGFVEDVRGAYGAGDVFFFPTREENEGIALLEAMQTGTPVVVRDIDTFDWLEDGHDCLKATERFDEAIETLTDPDERERIGENGRRTSERYTIPNAASDLADAYERVAG